MKVFIKNLKKRDIFIFNDTEYTVVKKYVDDDHPLRAYNFKDGIQLFCYDDLIVDTK